MKQKILEIWQTFKDYYRYTIQVSGHVFIGLCIWSALYGPPKIFRHAELAFLEERVDDVAAGLAENSDWQVAVTQGKIKLARK